MPPYLRLLVSLGTAIAMSVTIVAVPSALAPAGAETPPPAAAMVAADDPSTTPYTLDREWADVPEDRYAVAGGCYSLRSVAADAYVTWGGQGFAPTGGQGDAESFHFQAYDLGKYLLYGSAEEFLAQAAGPAEQFQRGVEPATERLPVNQDSDLPRSVHGDLPSGDGAALPAPPDTAGSSVEAAPAASELAEWVLVETGTEGVFTLQRPVGDGAEDDPGPVDPEIAGTLVVTPEGTLTVADGVVEGPEARFALRRTDGCAEWPEVEINIDGPVATGDTSHEEVRGYVDGHLHMMAFEFLGGRVRCGQPWHPYGVTRALVDCPDHEPGGHGAILEMALSGGDPVNGHDTVGWPTFGYWPRFDSYTHEQTYYKWVERAWRGGLRMFTNLLVDNNVLCEIYPYKENSCNEMDGVRLQAERLRQLERYIDAQSGGPGEGWFRIVTDPFEARRTMNEGRLAVVMGIEVSALFDCVEYLGTPQCTAEDIDRQLAEVHDLGVRQMELVNKFDNALSGVAGDSGSTGVIVNQGNRYETGHYWPMETCPEDDGHEHEHGHDKTQPNITDDSGGATAPLTGHDALAGGVLQSVGASGAAPVYPEGPHCNTIGLTDLGRHLIDRMVERGMIFDPDHMSAKARREALDHLEAIGYSGIISSHSWADDPSYPRIWEMGGVVTPMAKASEGFLEKWRRQRQWADDRFYFGLGYGADTNGFAAQGPPRNPAEGEGVAYPFEGFGGVTVSRQVSGEQVYDINTDGVDHYGLYPDWIEDVAVLAGDERDQFLEDMARGPEAYLQMWERGLGIAPDACRRDVAFLADEDFRRVERGMTAPEVLLAAGQPRERVDDVFRYCTERGTGTVHFRDGRVVRTTNTAAPLTDVPKDSQARMVEVRAELEQVDGGLPGALPVADGHDHVHASAVTSGSGPGGAALSLVLALLGLVAFAATRLSRRLTD